MVYLRYFAEREQPGSRLLFWRARYACISAWVNVDDVDAAKAIAAEKLQRKGWRFVRCERAVAVSEELLPTDWWVYRMRIKRARDSGASFEFYRASPTGTCMMWEPEFDNPRPRNGQQDAGETKASDVDPQRVPGHLRPAFTLCEHWAIGDDAQRSQALQQTSLDEKRAIVAAVMPMQDAIEQWCDAQRDAAVEPDEVTMFDRLLEAVSEMEAEIAIVERAAR